MVSAALSCRFPVESWSSEFDEAAFQAQWTAFMGHCSGCHKEYRKPKPKD